MAGQHEITSELHPTGRALAPRFRLGFRLLCLAAVLAASGADASQIAYDGFDYGIGDVVGRNGGTGDWKDSWSGDAEIDVVLTGSTYIDSNSRSLQVEGGRIELGEDPGGVKKIERSLNDKIGADGTADSTIWLSAIFDGSPSSEIHNVGLGDGLFFGQGGKDSGTSSWALHDVNGLIGDTGISAAASAFLVVRIEFDSSGDESVWMWVNPDLAAEPSKLSANVSGSASAFEADFVRLQLQSYGDSSVDELRIGSVFSDVTNFVVPEPGTGLLFTLGLAGLAATRRPAR